MQLETGSAIERYTVEGPLGRGGMAIVYKVRHVQLASMHALKVLTVASPSIRDRLLQEGRVQASLRHPNIVAVTDVVDVQGQPGIVMEFIEGPSLDGWLGQNTPTLEQALALFGGICAGVAAAHERGLVHRDLKPANVLLQPVGGMLVPKVADFGLAKALAEADEGGGLRRTRSGVTMGTPQYMAPEQIRDAKNVDRRADVFSLGCILFELVCGRPPFEGPDILSIFNAVASASYPPPISLVPDLPPNVLDAINGALRVDRDKRIPDCVALMAVLNGASIDAVIPLPAMSGGPAKNETFLDVDVASLSNPPPSHGGSSAPVSAPPPGIAPGGILGAKVGPPSQAKSPSTAPKSTAPKTPIPEGSLIPNSVSSNPPTSSIETAAPGRGRKIAAVGAGLGVVVAGVAGVLVLLALGTVGVGWYVKHSAESRFADALDSHGVAHGAISWRPGKMVAEDIVVSGTDGQPILSARKLVATGIGDGRIERVELSDTTVDLREGEHGELVGFASSGYSPTIGTLSTGPVTAKVHADGGDLTVSWHDLVLTDAVIGDRVDAAAFEAGGLQIGGADPLFAATKLSAKDGVLTAEGLDLWVRLRTDGWVDAPPFVIDTLPDWLGGLNDGVDPWGGLQPWYLPTPVQSASAVGGLVHVVDRAHAVRTVEWTLTAESMSIGPVSGTGNGATLPVKANFGVAGGSAWLDGSLRGDGLFRGQIGARKVPLTEFAAYLDPAAKATQMSLAGGEVDISLDGSVKQGQWAIVVDGKVDGAKIDGGTGKQAQLAKPHDVDITLEQVGSVEQAGSPLDDVVHAAASALFGTGSQSAFERRADRPSSDLQAKREERRQARVEARAEEPVEPPVVEAPPVETPSTGPVADTTPPPADPPPETKPPQDEPKDPLNRVNREVREALDDLRIPGTRRP